MRWSHSIYFLAACAKNRIVLWSCLPQWEGLNKIFLTSQDEVKMRVLEFFSFSIGNITLFYSITIHCSFHKERNATWYCSSAFFLYNPFNPFFQFPRLLKSKTSFHTRFIFYVSPNGNVFFKNEEKKTSVDSQFWNRNDILLFIYWNGLVYLRDG